MKGFPSSHRVWLQGRERVSPPPGSTSELQAHETWLSTTPHQVFPTLHQTDTPRFNTTLSQMKALCSLLPEPQGCVSRAVSRLFLNGKWRCHCHKASQEMCCPGKTSLSQRAPPEKENGRVSHPNCYSHEAQVMCLRQCFGTNTFRVGREG